MKRIHENQVWRTIITHAGQEAMDCIKKCCADENALPLTAQQAEIVETAARMAASIAVRAVASMHPRRNSFLDEVAADTRYALEIGALGYDGEIEVQA